MTDDVKDAVVRRPPRAELRAITEQAGMRPLRVDGWAKVESGITTVEEVLRVVQA
jgi:type IV pilus assembly protein PilB